MRYLLDTCTFLWMVLDDPALSERARAAVLDPESDVFLSAVSCWEIAVKHALGRLSFPEEPDLYIPRLRLAHEIEPLALGEEAVFHLVRLPPLHRDPFDRMLVCQAIVEGMVLLTPDRLVAQYPARVAW